MGNFAEASTFIQLSYRKGRLYWHRTMDKDFVMVERSEIDTSYLNFISESVDALSSALRKVSLEIHDHPELGYKEFHAHGVLTKFLNEQSGWKVTPSAYGIDTAFVAVYDSGKPGPAVSFNAEYDALKGIGHACGHNLICVASVGGALATAQVMRDQSLTGKVVLFGTPAEGVYVPVTNGHSVQ